MKDRDDISAGLLRHVRELTKPIRHVAVYQVRDPKSHRMKDKLHNVLHPSLIDQLREHMSDPPAPEESVMRGAYESRPPLHSDSLDALIRIEAWSARLLNVKYRKPLRPTVEENLAGLLGVATGLDDDGLADLAREVEHWHGWAQTITAWVSPPWQPSAACPLCERRNGLRVRLESASAVCVHCGERWTRDNIGLLAEHVRGEADKVGGVECA